jgi:thiol-disulfide isomerase/thioredoxin
MPAAIIAILAAACASLAAPPVFTDQPFEQARTAAEQQQKLLLVDATADWCPPCKEMDRTTWVDPRVEKWLGERAIAIQVDVDAEPEVARELRIRAMPTVIVFKNGAEFDRVVGYRSADQLLSWLEGVEAGRTSLDALRDEAGGRGARENVEARLELARSLSQGGKYEEAAEAYEWLWLNMLEHQPSYAGVRVSFMAGDMEALAREHPAARDRFKALRDQTEARLKQEPRTWDDLTDWIVLNRVIDDQDATLAWVDRIKGTDSGKETLRRVNYLVDDLLLDRGRWADYGMIQANPLEALRQEHAQIAMFEQMQDDLDDEQKALFRGFATESFIEAAANLHASLLAAEREAEAWDVADEAVRLLDDPALKPTLVRRALQANQPRPRHLELLKGAGGQEVLAAEVEKALEQ